ncbi:MAG: response regulator [Spirochaetes bacterium]|jgi:two-component system chemotaxis response regulator CheY|nr:response regulator [Spirochaetota bacterium]
MRFLIVEDDFGSRRLLQSILRSYGRCDVVVDGDEGIEAFRLAWEENDPYDAVLLDIMMPRTDGQEALKRIREIEERIGVKEKDQVKVVMTTALEDPKNVVEAYYRGAATSYRVKPIKREALIDELERIGVPLASAGG